MRHHSLKAEVYKKRSFHQGRTSLSAIEDFQSSRFGCSRNIKFLDIMLNKKGQIDKIITAFPVLLLVFLLMGIFIFLSFSVKVIKKPAFPEIILEDQFIEKNNILLKEVEIDNKKYSVIEGLYSIGYIDGPQQQNEKERNFYSKFTPQLVKLASESCLILLTSKNYIFVHKGIFDLGNKDRVISDYKASGKLRHLNLIINEKDSFIDYYYGGCIN